MKLVESFPQITDDNKILSVFQDTELLKIVVLQNTNTANVYIQNDTLIHRRDIKALEKTLNASLFPREDGSLKIMDQYQYTEHTAEEVFRSYQSSFLEEISEKGNVYRTVYLSSKIDAEDNTLYLKIKDSSLDRHYGGLLRNYFLNTYKERFGIDVNVELEYIIPEEKEQTTPVVELQQDDWSRCSETSNVASKQTTQVEQTEQKKAETKKVSAQEKQTAAEPKKTAYDKVKFYLEHETERKRIEDNGYETVRKHFNYPEVLKKMLHISNLDNLLK